MTLPVRPLGRPHPSHRLTVRDFDQVVEDLGRAYAGIERANNFFGGEMTASPTGHALYPEREALVYVMVTGRSDEAPYQYGWTRAHGNTDKEAEKFNSFGAEGTTTSNFFVDLADPEGTSPLEVDDPAWIRYDEAAGYWVRVSGGGGESTNPCFNVVLTDKDYESEEPWILYTAYRVTDSEGQLGSGSGTGSGSGGGGPRYVLGTILTEPLYHLQNVDLPVWMDAQAGSGSGAGSSAGDPIPEECVVRICKGAGDWYYIDDQPRMEIVKKRTPAESAIVNGIVYTVADLMRYDQVNKELVIVKTAYLLDVTNL